MCVRVNGLNPRLIRRRLWLAYLFPLDARSPPKDTQDNTGIEVFVDRLSKMAHLDAVPVSIDSEGTAQLYVGRV